MGCVSTAAHLGGSQVLGIIPTVLAEGNFAGKIVGEELRVPTMSGKKFHSTFNMTDPYFCFNY
ncbi:hypothetical protein DITRI_Ditri09bG0060300 [Diplodiscus trichospermus]